MPAFLTSRNTRQEFGREAYNEAVDITRPWESAEIFPGGGETRNLAYLFQIVDDAMQIDVNKTLYPLNASK